MSSQWNHVEIVPAAGETEGLEPAVDVRVHYVDVPGHPESKVIVIFFEAFAWGQAALYLSRHPSDRMSKASGATKSTLLKVKHRYVGRFAT